MCVPDSHGIAERVHIDIDGLSRSEQQKSLHFSCEGERARRSADVECECGGVGQGVNFLFHVQTLLQQSIHDQIHTFDKSLASGGIMKHYCRLSCCELWVGKWSVSVRESL